MSLVGRLVGAAADFTYAGRAYAGAVWARVRHRLPAAAAGHVPCQDAPVVLLPGILEPWSFLTPMARFLGERGHPVHFVKTLGLNLASLPVSTDRVVSFLEEDNLTGVVLVAHSKGGLIGKSVMLDARAAERVIGMVAVATPFGGSSLGKALNRFGPFARSPLGLFNPAGRELAALAAEAEVNSRIVSMSPQWDQMVPEGSRLDGAVNVTLDLGGHFRPMAHRKVWNQVHDHLHRLVAPRTDRETMPG